MFRSPLGDGLIILVIVLLFVGPKRLPMLSRSIGESIKEFKGGVAHRDEDKHLQPAPDAEVPAPRDTVEPAASTQRDSVV